MTFRINVAATYLSQVYVAVVGIAVTPLYLKALGTEAFGLVGFFTMLLAWFYLLDFGLSPAILRETARFRGGSMPAEAFRKTVRAIELLFLLLALLSAVLTALLAEPISRDWLQASQLSPATMRDSLWLMAGSIGLRFATVLYRALITGFEQLAWLGAFNAFIATLRAFAVLPALAFWGDTPRVFFWVQLAVSVVELAWLARHAYRLLPPASKVGLSWAPLRGVARFSATVAFTSGLTVAVTQADRLILSGLLTLQDYAYFNLAVQVAGAVLLAAAPLTAAILPRLTTLVASKADDGIKRIYALGTALTSAATLPVAATLALYGHLVLWAWTGRQDVAAAGSGVLALYAIGNAVHAHLSLPYALQFAHGVLRLHVIGSTLLVAMLVPVQVLMTMRVGALGAGLSWLGMNVLYALFWVPFAMRRVDPATHRGWLPSLLRAAAACLTAAALAYPLRDAALAGGRLAAAAFLVAVAALATAAAVLACAPLRELLAARLRHSAAGARA
ncbi:MAG: oligosaccharide flippase family protein [Rubrivivax sp.]|nr:oligosaccharide flippase family protein [Rubrivivax sp.]